MAKDWTNRLAVGDVVRFPNNVLRVVRAVKHPVVPTQKLSNGTEKYRSSITFAIRHCSWTGRCYTVYTSSDLRTMGCRPTKAKVGLRKKIDRLIKKSFSDGAYRGRGYTVGCCDVIGLVP